MYWISFFFYFRHVLLVIYIIFLWIEWILWGFVILQGMHVAKKDLRFDITDLASNQVKLCVPILKIHEPTFLTYYFFFSLILNLPISSISSVSPDVLLPKNQSKPKPTPNIGLCPEVSLVLAQFQTSWASRIVLYGSKWFPGYSNALSMSYK